MDLYGELEHPGNEDFDYSNRTKLNTKKKIAAAKDSDAHKKRVAELEKQQTEYLDIDNPALWTGDIDD